MSSLTFSIIQTNLFWEDKAANLSMLYEKIIGIQQKTNVVVLPEMFSTGFSMQPKLFAETMDGTTIQWMKKVASEKNIILTGSLMMKDGTDYFNRMIWMLPNGQKGIYDKRHLFAKGDEHNHYTPGKKRCIASVNGWKINLQVCYDLRFPVWSRQCVDQDKIKNNEESFAEYDVMIYVANWPEKRVSAWKTLLQARAIENQCYVIGVNRVGNDGNNIYHSGDSMVVNEMGEILYQKSHEEDIFTLTLDKESLVKTRTALPFLKDADSFMINE